MNMDEFPELYRALWHYWVRAYLAIVDFIREEG